MAKPKDFDLESFQNEVLAKLEELKVASAKGCKHPISRNEAYHTIEPFTTANRLLLTEKVRQYLCPALQESSDDGADIAKAVASVLAPLVLDGIVAAPLNPVLFAGVALLISWTGTATCCAAKW